MSVLRMSLHRSLALLRRLAPGSSIENQKHAEGRYLVLVPGTFGRLARARRVNRAGRDFRELWWGTFASHSRNWHCRALPGLGFAPFELRFPTTQETWRTVMKSQPESVSGRKVTAKHNSTPTAVTISMISNAKTLPHQ